MNIGKISVIIPAYNSEKTIEKCVSSVQSQTYKDLQIIVVDDGSLDDTKRIVKKMKQADDRIELISIPNGGVSHARNVGIDNAKGEYLTFVDSDDYIDQEMYESLIILLNTYYADIAHCSYKNVDENGAIINHVGNTGKRIVQNHDEALVFFLSGKLYCESLCNKIYKKDLFNNVRLDETIRMNEDVLANFCLFNNANKSVYIDRSFYSYVSNSQSVTHTNTEIFLVEQKVYVARKILDLCNGKPYEEFARHNVAVKCLNLYKSYVNLTDRDIIKKRSELKTEIKRYKNEYTRRNDKIAFYLLLYFPTVYTLVFRKYSKVRKKQLDPIQ